MAHPPHHCRFLRPLKPLFEPPWSNMADVKVFSYLFLLLSHFLPDLTISSSSTLPPSMTKRKGIEPEPSAQLTPEELAAIKKSFPLQPGFYRISKEGWKKLLGTGRRAKLIRAKPEQTHDVKLKVETVSFTKVG